MRLEALNIVEIMEDFVKHHSWSLEDTPAVVYVLARDLELVPAQRRVFDTTVSLLKDQKVTDVGLFGLPGVGKTTILKNINNSPLISDEFDMIIWLLVSSTENGSSKNKSYSDLQQSLYVRLGIDETSVDPRRNLLSKLKGKKILLLLDAVCEPLDLDLIGLPLDSLKVVLTSRKRSTCVQMVNREVKVDMLNKKDSHSMFTKLLGDRRSLRGLDMIHDIVDICGGLPLMISVAAKYFNVRGDSYSWERALGQLRKWRPTMKEAYNLLISPFFDSLDETTQRCFLYASLYPANTENLADLLVSASANIDVLVSC